MAELRKYQRRVQTLRKKEQPVQRSQEWFDMRNLKITASEVACCLTNTEEVCKPYVEEFDIDDFKYDGKCLSHFDTKEDYIIKKCKAYNGENVFRDSVFTLWGKKYEEIATRMYRQLFQTDVIEFGLLPHPRLKYIGASPDGITPDGVMLEIKCPYTRKINGIVPLHYWTQIQIQLEVADLDRCDFLECEIQELKSVEEFLSLEIIDTSQQKGILLNKTEFPNNSEEKYIYPPDNITLAQEYIDWSVEIIKELEAQAVKVEPIYFHIHKWNVVIVKRRKDWFASVRPIIKQVWEFITRLQQNREDFLKYQESIHIIKSKKFIEKWTNTTCMIEHDSDEECFPDKMDEDIECVCLINSTE
jgi:putative phage-type endonuclease